MSAPHEAEKKAVLDAAIKMWGGNGSRASVNRAVDHLMDAACPVADVIDAARIRQIWREMRGTLRMQTGQTVTVIDETAAEFEARASSSCRIAVATILSWGPLPYRTRTYRADTVTDADGTFQDISCEGVTVARLPMSRSRN